MVSGLQLFNPIVRKKYFIFWRSRLPMLLFLLLMLLLSMLLLSLLLLLPSFCRTNKNQTEKKHFAEKNQNLTFKAEHFFVQISYFPRRELDTILWHQSKVLLDSFWKKNMTPHKPPPPPFLHVMIRSVCPYLHGYVCECHIGDGEVYTYWVRLKKIKRERVCAYLKRDRGRCSVCIEKTE